MSLLRSFSSHCHPFHNKTQITHTLSHLYKSIDGQNKSCASQSKSDQFRSMSVEFKASQSMSFSNHCHPFQEKTQRIYKPLVSWIQNKSEYGLFKFHPLLLVQFQISSHTWNSCAMGVVRNCLHSSTSSNKEKIAWKDFSHTICSL